MELQEKIERHQKLRYDILDLLAQGPMTSNELAEKLSAKHNSIRTVLWKLKELGKIVRSKSQPVTGSKGPRTILVYQLAKDADTISA